MGVTWARPEWTRRTLVAFAWVAGVVGVLQVAAWISESSTPSCPPRTYFCIPWRAMTSAFGVGIAALGVLVVGLRTRGGLLRAALGVASVAAAAPLLFLWAAFLGSPQCSPWTAYVREGCDDLSWLALPPLYVALTTAALAALGRGARGWLAPIVGAGLFALAMLGTALFRLL